MGSENTAEETRALPDGTEHGRRSVGGQLVRPVQQVIAQNTGRAKLALVQSGTRVGHAEVEGRRRYEERFRSVPILLLVLQWFEVFFQFYSTWMRFFASFLNENREFYRSGMLNCGLHTLLYSFGQWPQKSCYHQAVIQVSL